MKFDKAFRYKVEVSNFEESYIKSEIETEVISNFFAEHSDYPKARDLIEFFISPYNPLRLKFSANGIAAIALRETFGKPDFTFVENKRYDNWVLKFQDRLFLTPEKRAIVLSQSECGSGEIVIEKTTVDTAIEFEKNFLNFCISFGLNNPRRIPYEHLKVLKEFENFGVIKDEEIDFNFFKNKKVF